MARVYVYWTHAALACEIPRNGKQAIYYQLDMADKAEASTVFASRSPRIAAIV
jgi:hypothetical protein